MYIIIDPLNDNTKGITTYCNLLYKTLEKINIKCIIEKREKAETLFDFSKKIRKKYDDKNNILEIPESFAPYFIPNRAKLHVRLHGMDIILKWKQHQNVSVERYYREKTSIENASFVSSPSIENWIETSKFVNLPQNRFIYPNPIPSPNRFEFNTNREIEVLFLGRFEKLKGICFLNEIQKRINKKIAVYSPKINLTERLKFSYLSPKKYKKEEVLSSSKIVILPSLYESFSMVKFEALSFGCKVVTWDTCPLILKNEVDYGVIQASYPDVNSFSNCIIQAFEWQRLKTYTEMYNSFIEKINDAIFSIAQTK